MTLRRPTFLHLIAVALAFAAALALFAALNRDAMPRGAGARAGDGAAPAPGHIARTTDEQIAALQETVGAHPTDANQRALLADAYLQKVRETGEFSYYSRAQGVLAGARRNAAVLTELGTLELARHHF